MLRKHASAQVLGAWRVPRSGTPRSLRKAAHRVDFEYAPRPGYLYVRSRAISSRTNDNHDTFPAAEIEKSYRTFLGKPCFVNHHNANHRRARGVIVAAALHRDRAPDGSPDTWVELLHEIDAVRFPKLAKAILAGRVNRTSMGVDCEYSQCSACGNRATTPAEYCTHMPSKKGMKIRRRDSDGKIREHLVHEICGGLTFFENSFLVEDPADPTAYVLGQPDARGLQRAAARRPAALTKTAAPATPHPGRLQGGTCRENCTYGGTHCAVCHEPVRINLHKTDVNGGWHHYDGLKRDHPALPAQPDEVMASIPAQQAAKDQARAQVADTFHRQMEELGGRPLPRRRRDEGDMPLDPFLSAFRIRGSREQDLPDSQCPNCGSPRARGRLMGEIAQCSDCGTHFNPWTGRERTQEDADIADAASANYEQYERERKAHGELFGHVTDNPTHPMIGWDAGPEMMRRRENPERQNIHPLTRLPYSQETEHGKRLYERMRERALAESEPFYPTSPASRSHMSVRRQAITGAEPREGDDIFAAPTGKSPVAEHAEHALEHGERKPGSGRLARHPFLDAPDHGPYYVTRDPAHEHGDSAHVRERNATYNVLDRHGRSVHPFGINHDGSTGMFSGYYGAMEDWYRLTHHREPSEVRKTNPSAADSVALHAMHKQQLEDHPPQFPHSRIDPYEREIAARPDARTARPEGQSPYEEYHGSYEVVRHPETGRFHVVDNQGRQAGSEYKGFGDQASAERSRDYIERDRKSKELGRGLAESMFSKTMDIAGEGATEEERASSRHLRSGQELMDRYAGGRGEIKFDPEDEGGEPYYHREITDSAGKQTGWYAKHYGGPYVNIHHHGTGDTAHESLHLPVDERGNLPRDFDDIELAKHLKAWHDEPEGVRDYYENDPHGRQSEPGIARWRRRHLGSRVQASPRYAEPGDHPFFQANDGGPHHLVTGWHDASDDEKDQGRRWYPDAHLIAKAIGHGDAALGAGMLAAYSPRTNWPANLFNAARSIHEGRALGPGDGAIMGMHQRPAARILAGEHHSQVLASPKVSAFAHLIEHGGQHGDTERVVVDRHALSAWLGRRVSDQDLGAAPLDKDRYYHHVEKDFIHAAHDLGITPEHLQAGLWLRQVRRNADEDQMMRAASGGTGRVRSQRRDRERWEEFRREHHPDIPGAEEMHHSAAIRRQAADPPQRVPPSVDTLRPEACPVCGDQDVFKGQRCPVCGFVAPPDIFRDPDIEQAQLNRQQLEEGKTESPLPEGPADEEQTGSGMDADGQLLHPDQIAPDGVPGVQPDPTAAGQGMLGQGPDGEDQPGGGEAVFDENGQPLEEEEPGDEDLEGEPGEDGELADPDELDDASLEDEEQGEAEEARGEQDEERGEQEIAEGEDELARAGQAPMTQGGDQGDQALAGGISALDDGDEDGEEEDGSPGKDQDDDDDPEGKKMGKRTAGTTVEAAQRAAIAGLRQENATLRAGLRFLAELAGAGSEVDAIMRQADLANPASPVPDPPQAPPTETTEQALAPGAMGDPARPGTEPGSVSRVPAEQTTTAITPGVEMQTPPATQLIDVTAPVQGTNPSQDGGVPIPQRRIETDVRIDPDPLKAHGPGIGGAGNDGTAYPWVIAAREGDRQRQAARQPASAEDERGARTFASIRLARLRVQAGLARGDELEVASGIERDASLTLHDLEREIGTLTAVSRTASAPAQPRYPRGLVPRTAARSAPSFASSPQAPIMAMASAVQGDDDGDIFLD